MAQRGKVSIDMDKVNKAVGSIDSRSNKSNGNYFRLQEGKNILRLIPSLGYDGQYDYGVFVSMHFGIDTDKDNKGPLYCPATLEEKCPICEASWSLKNSSNKSDKDQANAFRATQRYTCYAVVRGNKPENDLLGHIDIPVTVYRSILNLCQAYDDPMYVANHDIIITRKGKGIETEYQVLPGDECEVGVEYDEAYPLGESILKRVKDRKYCLRIVEDYGYGVDDEDDEEPQQEPRPTSAPASRCPSRGEEPQNDEAPRSSGSRFSQSLGRYRK